MIFGPTLRKAGLGGVLLALLATSVPALAQDDNPEARLRRLEAEVRALQRKVFPGGDTRFFEPEISTQPSINSTVTTPSTTAVTDILARLDALEAQVRNQTAQVEENSHMLRLLTDRVALLEGSGAPVTPSVATSDSTGPIPVPPSTAVASNAARMDAPAPSKPAAAAAPSDARLAAVQAIAKPQTDDPGEDEYSYGFRLWDAKFYPEAQQQLKDVFLKKYPDHWRATYARNLLGRAYLDAGDPDTASRWFWENWKADKDGARAPDSLLYLVEARLALKDTSRACIALAEFSELYPALATGRLKSQYDADRAKVKCN